MDFMEAPLPAIVTVEGGDGLITQHRFTRAFTIGREDGCDLLVDHGSVSRSHARIYWEQGRWWVQDLQSTNGTFLNGNRVEQAPIDGSGDIRLGVKGPLVRIEAGGLEATFVQRSETRQQDPEIQSSRSKGITSPEGDAAQAPLSFFARHYFQQEGEAGERTMMIRRAFQKVEQKQRRRYSSIILVIAVLGAGAVLFGAYKAIQFQRQQTHLRAQQARIEALEAQARQIFYQMKQLEVAAGASPAVKQLNRQYDDFVGELGIYDSLSEEDQIIYRMARMFGECDVDMPDGFVQKVHEYIGYWKATNRYRLGIERAQTRGYTDTITRTLLENGLPPQFFYLALQESNFDVNAVGPQTRFGYAKGMWQFIQKTADRYNLQTGPLVFQNRPDPLDERHDFEKSTRAAARYLHDVYYTDAQASGLLVVASYNWGEQNVLPLMRSLPDNPRDRNFWKLLEKYDARVPRETYHYVFYIFAAAVIGENPRLFGFDFDNPLAASIAAAEREFAQTAAYTR